MSTRGAIGRFTGDLAANKITFSATYHHWDSYPSGLGATLWMLYHERYNRNLDSMLKELIDDHPAGWSTINDRNWNLPAGDEDETNDKRPSCFCHGKDGGEEPHVITEQNAAGCGCEWAYAFLTEGKKNYMLVLCSYRPNGAKMIGFFGSGDPESKWEVLEKIDLDGELPDWKRISESA